MFNFLEDDQEISPGASNSQKRRSSASSKRRTSSKPHPHAGLREAIHARLNSEWGIHAKLALTPGRESRRLALTMLIEAASKTSQNPDAFCTALEERMYDRYFVLFPAEYAETLRSAVKYMGRRSQAFLRLDPDLVSTMTVSEMENLASETTVDDSGPSMIPRDSNGRVSIIVDNPLLQRVGTETRCRNPKCRGNDVSFTRLQTRSGDEAVTVFYVCRTCGTTWKE